MVIRWFAIAGLVLAAPALAWDQDSDQGGWGTTDDQHDQGAGDQSDQGDEDSDEDPDEDPDEDHGGFDGPFVSGQTAADLAGEEGGMDCSGMEGAAVVLLPLLALGRRRLTS